MSDVRAIGTSLTKKKSGDETADWIIGSLTSIGEVTIESNEIDVTTLDSPDGAREYISGDIDAGELAIAGYIKKPTDEQTVSKMLALVKNGSVESWEIGFPSGAKWELNAFVKSFGTTEETPDGLIGFQGNLRISGLPTYTPKA